MTQQRRRGRRNADGKERDAEGKDHGPERTEGQKEHDGRREQTQSLARAPGGRVQLFKRVTAELDFEARRADCLARRLYGPDVGLLQQVRLFGEVHHRVSDLVART